MMDNPIVTEFNGAVRQAVMERARRQAKGKDTDKQKLSL
jgi:hypothetical protein